MIFIKSIWSYLTSRQVRSYLNFMEFYKGNVDCHKQRLEF